MAARSAETAHRPLAPRQRDSEQEKGNEVGDDEGAPAVLGRLHGEPQEVPESHGRPRHGENHTDARCPHFPLCHRIHPSGAKIPWLHSPANRCGGSTATRTQAGISHQRRQAAKRKPGRPCPRVWGGPRRTAGALSAIPSTFCGSVFCGSAVRPTAAETRDWERGRTVEYRNRMSKVEGKREDPGTGGGFRGLEVRPVPLSKPWIAPGSGSRDATVSMSPWPAD
jgi:hypothetical protein